jgi:hypothetical protein
MRAGAGRLRQHSHIVCARDGFVPKPARFHQSRQIGLSVVVAGGAAAACAEPNPLFPMRLTPADGTDGIFESCAHRDDPPAGMAFPTERNVDAHP